LVEGPSDLIYLQYFSNLLQSKGREGLRDDVTIVPVGGLGNLATFVSLIGANQLELVMVTDYAGAPDQRIEHLVREKIIQKKQVLSYADFRGDSKRPASDVEDLFNPSTYLVLFNGAHKDELAGSALKVGDLPARDRMVVRVADALQNNGLQVRPSGGFNHYRPADYLASHPLSSSKQDAVTLDRFESLFQKVNSIYTDAE